MAIITKIHLTIKGRVHGVGFRQYVYELAHELHLTGWVRNMPDGMVEVIAEGDKKSLDMLYTACKKGPALAHVSNTTINFYKTAQEFTDFTIRYDKEK